jgi:Flp pilus assembly protein TadD
MVLVCVLSLTAITPAQQQQPRTAQDYVLEGIAAQRAGNHQEAVRLYAAAIRLNPKDFAWECLQRQKSSI